MKNIDLKLFSRIPTLYTDRLILRRIQPTDVDDIYEYAQDMLVTKYLLWNPHCDKSYTRRYVNYIDKKYKKCEFYDWGIEYGNKMIGTCGFTSFDIDNNSAEIGYVLNRCYWNLGIATEAVGRVISFGFDVLGLNRISARYMIGNEKSEGVMKKNGMEFEGVLRSAVLAKGKYVDVGIYSIIRKEPN